MNESVLRALLQLFALVTEAPGEEAVALARKQVQAYLAPKIAAHRLDEFLDQFEDYLKAFSRKGSPVSEKQERKKSALSSVKVVMLCEEINDQLAKQEKITVLIRLVEFVKKGGQISFRESGFLQTLAHVFNISESVFTLILHFVENDEQTHSELLYIGSADNHRNLIVVDGMNGSLVMMVLPDTHSTFIKYMGGSQLRLDNAALEPDTIYPFNSGSIVTGPDIEAIYQSDAIRTHFSNSGFEHDILFTAENISHKFPNGSVGLHPLSVREVSGTLVGIMGASGAGKSTLLNVLNGNAKVDTGYIRINEMPVRSRAAKQLVGYVPQDDLLIEELTVFENLFLSGRLCLPVLSKADLIFRIENLLQRIDLFDIRHLRVGSVLDKLISGGQRKRLNIALELLREPSVLFVDEPTSGLSSQDSEMVMQLLKGLTHKGLLIFVVIHQPSVAVYKLLDKLLLLDRGGYLVYNNHPMIAPAWFRERAGFVESATDESHGGSAVDPDEILRILEERKVDSEGHVTNERVRSPQEWYATYLSQAAKTGSETSANLEIPVKRSAYKIPSALRQSTVHFKRNLLAKVRNKTYLLVALLEAPLLALIIGYFTRYAAGNAQDPSAYVFFLNKNLPAFLFMVIVVAIFVGMQISAEEIIRDRKILKRESFLNLSRIAYINSKVLYLMLLSAIQAFLLVVVGNLILEIHGMTGYFFGVLFPTFFFANLLGLNISAAFKSVVTIYILVPFLVVPQLLLSGVIVDFDTLQKPKNQGSNTPFVADIMVARWAYEAMAVAQFKHNLFQQPLFDDEMEKQESLYQFSLRIPKLQDINRQSQSLIGNAAEAEKLRANLTLLSIEVAKTNRLFAVKFDSVDQLSPEHYKHLTADLLNAWLNEIERQYRRIWERADDRLQLKKSEIAERLDLPNDLEPLKETHHNQKLEEHVKNSHELYIVRQVNDVLVRKSDYIYRLPESQMGRAHFYAPFKYIGNLRFDTYWFNVLVIWGFNLVLYLMLWNNTLLRLMRIRGKN